MNRDEHIKFIKADLSDVLKEIVSSVNLLGTGLEFYAVNGYILQSMLLQLTGAQEQKMKCICWEIATDNLEYRYKRYYKKWDLNECSTLLDKTKVFEDLLKGIRKYDTSYKLFADAAARTLMLQHVKNVIDDIFADTNINKIHAIKYAEFDAIWSGLDSDNLPDHGIFKCVDANRPFDNPKGIMWGIYSLLYKARNRYAHNATSYQMNLPRFYEINDADYQKYNNIFLFYAELLLIDEIFRSLYDKYELVVEFA